MSKRFGRGQAYWGWDLICPPDDGGNDEECGQEDICALVVAGMDASKVLEACGFLRIGIVQSPTTSV